MRSRDRSATVEVEIAGGNWVVRESAAEMRMRVLVVEDEPNLADAIREGLEEEHYDVDLALDGTSGLERAREQRYALIVLDLMLPGVSGWQICERLREDRDTTPILMLTARGAPDDRVRGLELGADDYLAKPFHFPELLARVRSLLRRDKVHRGRTIRIGDLTIDTKTRSVARGGRSMDLSPREYSLLEALASHEGHVLTRDTIQENIWMDDRSLNSWSNTVEVHIGKLRRKIDSGFPNKLIHTVFGVGYVLRRPDTEN
jgi:DNA-binding response OmpR family regulator